MGDLVGHQLLGRWQFCKDDEISSWLNQFNIIFLMETHFTKGQKFNFKGYQSYHNAFSNVSDKTSRWGLSCFISHNIPSYINNVNCDLENHIIITLKDNHRIFGSYIPPADSII